MFNILYKSRPTGEVGTCGGPVASFLSLTRRWAWRGHEVAPVNNNTIQNTLGEKLTRYPSQIQDMEHF